MDKRTIVAKLVQIANELDEKGFYEEADQLTRVAQLEGLKEFGKGLLETGKKTWKGIKNDGLALLQAGSDINEIGSRGVANLDADSLVNEVNAQAETNGYSLADINALIFDAAPMIKGNPQLQAQALAKLNSAIDKADILSRKYPARDAGPVAGAAHTKVDALKLKARQMTNQLRSLTPGPSTARSTGERAQAGQLGGTNPAAWVANKTRNKNFVFTRAQLYDMAAAESPVLANDVAAYLDSKSISGRNQKVPSYIP
jgi:hypothetical protein